MRKFICACLYSFVIAANAYECNDCRTKQKINVQEVADCPYVWSYAALGQTMQDMRQECEVTNARQFTVIGNWVREKQACFSINELLEFCMSRPAHVSLRSVKIGAVNSDGEPKYCKVLLDNYGNEQNLLDIIPGTIAESEVGCMTLVAKWMAQHQMIREMGLNIDGRAPGTYVKKVKLNNGSMVYRVLDVVLSQDYYQGNTKHRIVTNRMHGDIYEYDETTWSIDQSVNQLDNNTKIYEVTDNGDIVPTGLHTWTNDMFLDVQSTKSVSGGVRGAADAYIFYNDDITGDIYALYDKRRGKFGAVISNAWNSLPDNDFDIKEKLYDKYKVDTQKDKQAHANGVIFNGRVASLDFLGNMLYGMNREETVLPDFLANGLANVVSIASNKGNIEPETVKNAWDFGADIVKKAKNTRDMAFERVQTKTKEIAYMIARDRMLSHYGASEPVNCTGNCNKRPGTDDIVICTDANGLRIEFVFDDICN